MFGRYQLLDRIAVGGMAEIYRGRMSGVGGFEKPVAIKKILPRLAKDERFIKLLVNEAKINASLSHANIVQIHDLGINEDGEYFLVLEYVDGCDLRGLLEACRQEHITVSKEVALYVAGEVCQALDHAHRLVGPDGTNLGLVHRDVSPANILISYAGEVKLTDFGIAKQVEEASIVTTLKGKFAYMSPEQARSMPIDQTSDLFSLGAILFELLLGRRAFHGATDFETLQMVREARFSRPRELDPTFPPELEAILLRALSPRPRDRWQTAAELGAALREYRFTLPNAGGGAAELATLLSRLFPTDKDEGDEHSEFITINTVAGFAPGPSLTPTPASVRELASNMTPSFDLEPTAVAPDPMHADVAPFDIPELHPRRKRSDLTPTPADPLPPPPQTRLMADMIFTPAPEVRDEFRESSPIHVEEARSEPKPVESGQLLVISTDRSTPGATPIRMPVAPEPTPIRPAAPLPSTQPFGAAVRLRPKRWPQVVMLGTLAAAAVGWLVYNNRPAPRTVLSVETDPPGAQVLVDDVAVPGVTPLRAPMLRDGKTHDVELRLADHWPVRRTERAEGDRIALSEKLEPARLPLKIRSRPARARVSVDGTFACETPCTIPAVETRRKHVVLVELDGYSHWQREILVPTSGVPPLDANLIALKVPTPAQTGPVAVAARAPTAVGTVRRVEGEARLARGAQPGGSGEVVIKSEPWARILVDGKDIGRNTSASPFKLPLGKHEITLVNPPLKLKKSLSIVVKGDEATRKFVQLR